MLKADIELRSKGQGFNPNSPDFTPMVASVRRDNGILAMDFDLFAVARRNLENAIAQRPDDASAHFYLAKLERLTARSPEERRAPRSSDSDESAHSLHKECGSINLGVERQARP